MKVQREKKNRKDIENLSKSVIIRDGIRAVGKPRRGHVREKDLQVSSQQYGNVLSHTPATGPLHYLLEPLFEGTVGRLFIISSEPQEMRTHGMSCDITHLTQLPG